MNATRICLKQIKQAKVGEALKSIEEVKGFLNQYAWSVQDLVSPQEEKPQELPNTNEIQKLLRLSGLPQIEPGSKGDKELQEIRKNLATQITFINKLQSIELPDEANVNPKHARIMPRTPLKSYTLQDLLASTQSRSPMATQDLGEQTNSWDSTSLASNTKSLPESGKHRFFVLREGLIKNRQ